MHRNHAWVISDDPRLQSSLRDLLVTDWERGPIEARALSEANWLDSGDCGVPPTWVVCDLRRGRNTAIWQQLAKYRDQMRKSHRAAAPVVGLIDGGFETHQALCADQHLTCSVCWPATTETLVEVLHDAERISRRQGQPSGDFRILRGKQCKFLTHTPAMFSMLDDLEIAAQREFTILLIGETGTGKTTLARIIHELSPRHHQRFVTVACGSLPGDLIDSELFGHVKGAFTSADRAKEGKFDVASGGSILLDEIDVLGPMQQAKLLRVLESGEFEPVGSNDTRVTSARSIVASNVCLEELMAKQQFRSDLYYRLNQVKFEIPPLRERPNDIIPLAVDVIEDCCQQHTMSVPQIHPDFLQVLRAYSWPGNIRELRNEVRRAVLFCRDGVLTPKLFSPRLVIAAEEATMSAKGEPVTTSGLASEVAQTERELIEQMLRSQNFNRAATARALGISRVTLYNKIRKYGIRVTPPGLPAPANR